MQGFDSSSAAIASRARAMSCGCSFCVDLQVMTRTCSASALTAGKPQCSHNTENKGCCQRPYRVECTGSLPNSEVKRRRARLVLGWGTAREDLRVLLAFCLWCPAGARSMGAGNGAVTQVSPWAHHCVAWPSAGVPRLLDSTATGGSVQAAVWNAVCKHDWKVGIVECAE